MNGNEFIKVIGFDLGHGEFSIAELSTLLGNEPQIIEINGERSQITAVGKDRNGKTIIGNNAVKRPDVNNFEICFKKKPSICSTLDKEKIHNFVVEVYNNLLEERHVEDIENLSTGQKI